MLKIILLLTPIYVTVFWSIVLHTDTKRQTPARFLLSKFMVIAFVVYFSHFIFFASIPAIYKYLDPFYQFASLLVFPIYHIYFRLLTIDPVFSLRKHWRYLIMPTILFVLYLIGFLLADSNELEHWIFNRKEVFYSPAMIYLKIVHTLIRFTFLVQVIVSIYLNYKLIKDFGDNAQHYYSEIQDSKTRNVKILNSSMIITGAASIILAALGRDFFQNELTGITLASLIFSTMLFVIGWLGDQQKVLNPTFELNSKEDDKIQFVELTKKSQQILLNKIIETFEVKKVYLKSDLNINHLATLVGTNRTYISSVINQHFNHNFCSFVNEYRIKELEKNLQQNSEITYQQLADQCGFGSIDSMKRVIFGKTNLPFHEWRNQQISAK